VEDLRALIAAAGGRAFLSAMSSGGALALATAEADPGVAGLVLYEPPFVADQEDPARFTGYTRRLSELLDSGRTGDAVAHFMTHVGVPEPAITGLRGQPAWAALEAIAPTLAYDDELLAGSVVPRERAARVSVPALVVSGSASPPALQQAAKATAEAIPTAEHRSLDGQTHDVAPDVLAQVIIEFLGE
jgi:pimeloyl-ACP methyl ester carboxylesterase